MTQAALWLLVALPAVVGGFLALSRPRRGTVAVSLATAVGVVVLAVAVTATRSEASVPFMAGSDLAVGVDALSALVVPTVAGVTLLVLVFAAGERVDPPERFHGLMLLFASAALVTATAQTLPTLLLAWEVMGATSYALIGFWWRDDHRVSSGLVAFLTTRTADLGLYVAAGAALAGAAGLALADLPAGSAGWRHVVAAGILVAALGKAAQLPFSFWLSRAMDGPSPVSALLHSAAMVAMGGYLLLRTEPLLAATGWAAPAAAWAGALTALVLGAVALTQRDVKQLLAASTAAQLGFVVMGAGVGSVSGGAAHLVAHASTKALLFLAAGVWLTALGTKQLDGLRGAARRWRWVGWSASVGALALAGVAPLALWATKDSVLAAAREQSPWLYAVGLAGAGFSAAYAGRLLGIVWRRGPGPDRAAADRGPGEAPRDEGRPGVLTQAPLVVLAGGAGLLGVLALPPVGDAVARSLGEQPLHPTPLEAGASALLALLVLGLVWRRPVPEPRWAREWLGLEPLAHQVVVVPTLALAARLARFDDHVIDRAVDHAAASTLAGAHRAAGLDLRGLDGAVEALARRLQWLGRLARRPQTGQLHHYYIQAIAVLVVGVLLLVTVR